VSLLHAGGLRGYLPHRPECEPYPLPVNAESLSRARELFFAYDGFKFQMWHDGDLDEYKRLAVPPDVEAEWLRALTAERLAAVGDPGNWYVPWFLENHADYAYVELLSGTTPRGALWEQCAFLEELIAYVGSAARVGRATGAQVASTADSVTARAERLRLRCRSERTRRRVDAIIASVATLRSSGVQAPASADFACHCRTLADAANPTLHVWRTTRTSAPWPGPGSPGCRRSREAAGPASRPGPTTRPRCGSPSRLSRTRA
jgi:hypothetical protein